MKKLALFFLLAGLMLAACDTPPEQPVVTDLPPAPTTEAAPTGAPTDIAVLPTEPEATAEQTVPEATAGPTEPAEPIPEASPTLAAAETATDEPTAAATETVTEEPSPEASDTAAPEQPTDEPATAAPPAAELFMPGQQNAGTLTAGGAMAYLVQGQRFQPIILFAEPNNELNIALAAYVGDQTGQTTPEGVTPPAAADNALAGRPEILVLSPESDGLYTLVVRAVAGEGSYAVRLFDLTTAAPGVAVQQTDVLAAGAESIYEVTSNGARPVIVVARPTDQSDIVVDILGADGTLLTTANYSGPGGVETAYVLPLGAASYFVHVREANSCPAAYQIVIITLD